MLIADQPHHVRTPRPIGATTAGRPALAYPGERDNAHQGRPVRVLPREHGTTHGAAAKLAARYRPGNRHLPVPEYTQYLDFVPPGFTLYCRYLWAAVTHCYRCYQSFEPCGAIMYVNGCILVEGYDAVLRSSDGGHSWSAPVKTMGSANNGPFPFASGSGNPLLTLDRPWIAVDQSSNTVYAAGHNIADHEGFVTASTNDGQSFGTIYAIDSPTYPSGGLFGGNIAAAHGVLAVAYTAASAPGATCPCVIFETSTNHGATFTAHVIPTVDAAAQPVPFVAADPNAKGHFAVTIFDATGTENQVYTTSDNGATWSGPALVGESFPDQQFKPWLSYGPGGELLLVWRTWLGTPNTAPYDVWAAVGHNQGRRGPVFSAPMQVSSVAGAYPPQYGAGDDFSWVIADQKFVDIGWGDARDLAVGAGVQTWFARIPLTTLEGTHA